MSNFTISMALLVGQVSTVMIVALILDIWLARRSPNAAGRMLFIAMLALPVLTAAMFCPLPNWWNWRANMNPIAAADLKTDLEKRAAPNSHEAATIPAVPVERGGVSLRHLLEWLPAAGAHWQPTPRIGRMLALAWLAGVGICVLRLLGGLWSVNRLRRRSRIVPDLAVNELLRSIETELKLNRSVELREAQVSGLPAMMGWRRPVILLPMTWRRWTDGELRSALAHELAHIAAGDFLNGLVAQLAAAIHFYHPLLRQLMNRLRLRREMAADALAARHAGGRREYVRALARLALDGESAGLGVPTPLLLSAHGGILFRRIQMLRNTEGARPLSRTVRGLALAALAASALLASSVRVPAGTPDIATTTNTAAPSDLEPFHLSYLAANPDIHAVVGIRPAVLFAQQGMADRAKAVHKELETLLKSVGRSMPEGIDVTDIDEIVVDAAFFVNKQAPPPNRAVMCGSGHFMIRMRKDVDWTSLLKSIFGEVKTSKQEPYTIVNVHCLALGPQEMHYCVVDARTLLMVQEKDGKYLTPVPGAKAKINLGASWSKVERSPLAIGFDNRDDFFTKKLAPEVKDITGFPKLISALDSVCFDLNFKPGLAGRFFIQGKNDAQAHEIVALIGDLANLAKTEFDGKPAEGESRADAEVARKLATEILQSGKVQQTGAEVCAEGRSTVTLAEFLPTVGGDAQIGPKK